MEEMGEFVELAELPLRVRCVPPTANRRGIRFCFLERGQRSASIRIIGCKPQNIGKRNISTGRVREMGHTKR